MPGTVGVLPSAISRIVLRRILPERVFGRAGDDVDLVEGRDRADLVAHPLHELGAQALAVANRVDPALEHDEGPRDLALELVARRR